MKVKTVPFLTSSSNQFYVLKHDISFSFLLAYKRKLVLELVLASTSSPLDFNEYFCMHCSTHLNKTSQVRPLICIAPIIQSLVSCKNGSTNYSDGSALKYFSFLMKAFILSCAEQYNYLNLKSYVCSAKKSKLVML